MNIFKSAYLVLLPVVFCAAATYSQAATILDSAGDIDPGISTGGGTLDILSMEVSSNGTDIAFALTLNGNVSSTDWGQFMIGIATGKTDGTLTGNGWGRPISLSYDNDPFAAQIVGMNYWIGSWVDGGGAELLSYSGAAWTGPTTLAGYSVVAGATSTLNYSIPLASLGLAGGDTFYFDAYSSGGGGADSAIDALSNPNFSITDWAGPYTSSTVGSGGVGLSSYTIIVPEPSTFALLGLGGIAFAMCRSRRRLHS
jgi:hypothetical protein